MKRIFRKKSIILASAALALTGALSIGSAMAYFTTYSTASGGVEMKMGFTETVPNEEVDEAGKHVIIKNIGDYDCFVRVKIFSEFETTSYKAAEGWKDGGDGYWYYEPILKAGGETPELLVAYEFPKTPEGEEPEELNIVVIQECTPVLYKADGTAYADWNHVITDSTEEQQ